MLKKFLPLVALMLVCGCTANERDDAGAAPAAASQPASPRSQNDEDRGFVPLFNGKDLTGWVYGNGGKSKAGAGYQVRDGVLYCTAADGGLLFTEKQYDNFVLRFEFKLTPGANNGVAIRAPLDGNAAFEGMELQILDDTAPKYANLRPEQYHGCIYDVFAPQRGHLKPVGEWNEQEVVANGRWITVKLNGHTILDADLDTVKDEAKLKKHPGLQNRTGHIGFLGHGSPVEFRNVRLKEL